MLEIEAGKYCLLNSKIARRSQDRKIYNRTQKQLQIEDSVREKTVEGAEQVQWLMHYVLSSN